jgi:hypothetical protein
MYACFGDRTSIAKYCIRSAGTLKLRRRVRVRPKARIICTTHHSIVIFETKEDRLFVLRRILLPAHVATKCPAEH